MSYLLICAFIANAASFLLPISKPANLVIFSGGEMPPLSRWLSTFLLPSIVSIAVTFICFYCTQRRTLSEESLAVSAARAVVKDQTPGIIRGAQHLINLNIRPTQRDRRHSAL
jgi:arsenical pump membrane protein